MPSWLEERFGRTDSRPYLSIREWACICSDDFEANNAPLKMIAEQRPHAIIATYPLDPSETKRIAECGAEF